MSFGIELGMLAAERDWAVRDARRVDACVERRERRDSMRVRRRGERVSTYREQHERFHMCITYCMEMYMCVEW
jgi:hypothetical protein